MGSPLHCNHITGMRAKVSAWLIDLKAEEQVVTCYLLHKSQDLLGFYKLKTF